MEKDENILERTAAFASEHAGDDCDRLLFNASKYPGIDMRLAVDTISGRKRLSRKLPDFAAVDGLLYPGRLCTEQCSSGACAAYKASLVQSLVPGAVVADITGGLGADACRMSRVCSRVVCFERNALLADCVRHNFKVLGRDNIEVRNEEVSQENIGLLLSASEPSLVYADPARRNSGGGRTFSIRDYEPDITAFVGDVFRHCRYFLVKISPMEDLDSVFESLPQCREIHVVSYAGECKELLLVLDRDWPVAEAGKERHGAVEEKHVAVEKRKRVAVSLSDDGITDIFGFSKEEEAAASPYFLESADEIRPGMVLYVPSASILKAGAYNLFAEKFSLTKLDVSTHLYLERTDGGVGVSGRSCGIPGKAYGIIDVFFFDKKSIAEVACKIKGRADVTAKNIPLSSEELARRLKIKSGGGLHVWGCRAAGKNILLLAERLFTYP